MELKVISPFPIEALPRVWGWLASFRDKMLDDFAPRTLEEFVNQMASRWDRQKSWAIYADGELGGLITFEKLTPWLGTAHLLLKPDFQGKGIAVKVCRTAAAEIFAAGTGKIAFFPLAGNLPNGSLLINLGARREGTLKDHTLCGGKPADVWLYGLTKIDFEERLKHASRSSSIDTSPDRSGQFDRGGSPGGPGEDLDTDRHIDADILASDAGHHGPVGGVLGVIDSKPDVHARPDAGPGIG